MKLLKSSLLGTAAGFAAAVGAQAADLPAKKAAPIEYVRVCGAYGAGFFYIPGTDTCLRVSGRARFEAGYGNTFYRGNGGGGNGNNQGDTGGYIGLLRLNLDARTQTGYGTLRAFVRLEAASRTGATQSIRSGTQERIGRAFAATGQDQAGRDQQFMNVDKAFIQFAGLTAGRASSFFDFYAHDFEIMGGTSGSDVPSTNLIAYTYTGDGGFSATVSAEDPLFRRNGIYTQETGQAAVSNPLGAPARVFNGFVGGVATFNTVDVVERQRTPDFVGVLRYDQPWGSLQLSGASHELNTGDFNYAAGGLTAAQAAAGALPAIAAGANVGTAAGPFAVTQPGAAAFIPAGTAAVTRRPSSEFGWAVQAGAKFNLPFIAPGDGLYLQAAYDQGATLYAGSSAFNGSYITQISTINGAPFNQYVADATLNPFTGKIQLSESYSVVGSFLHYWAPEWRSAFFASYSAINFASGARAANAIAYGNFTPNIANPMFTGNFGQRSFALSPVLRDNYQYVAGASLIWSPVKDLDIGVEGLYTRLNLRGGRVVDQTQPPLVTARQIDAGAFVKTVSGEDTWQGRLRVQRDF